MGPRYCRRAYVTELARMLFRDAYECGAEETDKFDVLDEQPLTALMMSKGNSIVTRFGI